MKRWFILILMVLTMSSIGISKPYRSYRAMNDDNLDIEGGVGFFYSSLSPYGEWVNCDVGVAWRPYHVANYWRPYLDGRWVWTSYGWYWVSYEPFGWATFHYGRWTYDDYYGWIWIPDDVWGPAWVEWRYDDDYIGWAPLPPIATFSVGVGITFTNTWVAPVHYWNFVPCRNFTSTRVVDYVQPPDRVRRVFGNMRETVDIRAENDRVINRGIDVGFVERRGNVRINQVDVVQNNRGTGERIVRENNREHIEVFRPHLDTRSRGGDVRQPDIRRSDRSGDNGGDRSQGNVNSGGGFDRGRYDQQQPRVPSGEERKNETGGRSRENRDLNQRFEIPKRANPEPSHERQNWDRAGRGSVRQQWNQERSPERKVEPNVERSPREEFRPGKRPEQVQKQRQSQDRDRKDRQSEGRGRKP